MGVTEFIESGINRKNARTTGMAKKTCSTLEQKKEHNRGQGNFYFQGFIDLRSNMVQDRGI